jgi:hypothetical protein
MIGKKAWAISSTEILTLPVLNFKGRIKLVEDYMSTSRDEIRELLGIRESEKSIIGFDTESKPKAHYSTVRNPTALVQLASEDVCVLIRTAGKRELPSCISDILEDHSVVKVGQGIGMDVRDLKSDFRNIGTVNNVVDLHRIATRLNCQPKSLQGLVGMFLRKRLLKDMRISNWESDTLRAEQVQYAAVDAWAARAVYLEMLRRGIKADELGGPDQIVEEKQSFPIQTEIRSVSLPIGGDLKGRSSAQVQLVDTCVQRGFILRLCGFEKVPGTDFFKCVFEVKFSDGTSSIFQSRTGHNSIRSAQEDAAAVALESLVS